MGSEEGGTPHASGSPGRPHTGADRRVSQAEPDKAVARPDVAVARLATDEWGVLSIRELLSCGLNREAVRVRVANGRLHSLHRGVYAVGHGNVPLEGLFLAAVKACGGVAALSFYAASAHWGFVEWDGRRPEVTVLGEGTRVHPGIRIHRTQSLDPVDVRRRDGIPVTAPARTLLDLASLLPEPALRSAVRRAQSLQLVSIRELNDVLFRLAPRRGSAQLARIMASGPAPTRSVLEDVVLDLMQRGELVTPNVNVPLALDGRRVIPDFRWPEQKLVVEADGAAWHDNKLAREDDAERQAILEAHGERVIRITWEQAISCPTQTLSRLRAAGAPPSSERRICQAQPD